MNGLGVTIGEVELIILRYLWKTEGNTGRCHKEILDGVIRSYPNASGNTISVTLTHLIEKNLVERLEEKQPARSDGIMRFHYRTLVSALELANLITETIFQS